MNDLLLLIICPQCKSDKWMKDEKSWVCGDCGQEYVVVDGKPVFSPIPAEIEVSEKRERGRGLGTPWRQANWHFLEEQVAELKPEAKILDIGSGRGDFARVLTGRHFLSVEIYPYPEVDVVCDLTKVVPLRASSFDVVLLMNVCEHVFQPNKLIAVAQNLLTKGGKIIVTIPFMLKIHQAPFDFGRYTNFALEKMADENDLKIEKFEGFYDPAGLIWETVHYYQLWGTHHIKNTMIKSISKGMVFVLSPLVSLLTHLNKPYLGDPNKMTFPAPMGYQVVYKKN
jgi:SAM-dependent methyltransferase